MRARALAPRGWWWLGILLVGLGLAGSAYLLARSFALLEVSVSALPAHLENHGDCKINSTDRSLIEQPCDATDADGDDVCDVQP